MKSQIATSNNNTTCKPMSKIQNETIKKTMIPDEVVINKIYLVRDQKVMLDSDLAELYGVETKRLNEQVRRNIARFPDDFRI